MTTKEVQEALRKLGWPIKADGSFGEHTFRAVKNFQRGFAFWDLIADGAAGERTQRALKYSVLHGGLCSPHFAYREFKSPGNGWIKVDRELARGLEEYRDEVGNPVIVTSGYRDPKYNASIGSPYNSQHVYGNAADVDPTLKLGEVKRLKRFSGIGVVKSSGKVIHMDVRHRGPNTSGGTIHNPTVWFE
jgi:hypothetical protein